MSNEAVLHAPAGAGLHHEAHGDHHHEHHHLFNASVRFGSHGLSQSE